MNDLYLKIGNSSVKALFKNVIYDIEDISQLKKLKIGSLYYYFTDPHKFKDLLPYLNSINAVEFTRSNIRLIENGYKYPDEIGIDRLLGASFFYRKYKKDLIFVDLGTAITVNIIRDKRLTGGYILPGINVYYKSLSNVGRLPLIKNKKIFFEPGKSTMENIRNGYFLLLKSFFDKIKKREKLPLYASGGEKMLIDLDVFEQYNEDVDLKEMRNYEEN